MSRILFLLIVISLALSLDAAPRHKSEESSNESLGNLINIVEIENHEDSNEIDSDEDDDDFLGNFVPIKLNPIGKPQDSYEEEMGAKYKCNANGCKIIQEDADGDDDDDSTSL
jgi:hypothetical protein